MSFANKGNYTEVNATWPESIPPLEDKEALAAARRLYRIGAGVPFRGKLVLTSGNRYTWTYQGTLRVNAARGWRNLVHDLSHLIHRKVHPGARPHDGRHTWLEKQLIKEVVERGWLDGRLRKAPKAAADPTRERYQSICQRLKRWQTKMRRAETAIKKLARSKHRYEQHGLGETMT